MHSPNDAVATHPRREKLSAYERAQIYLAKKQAEEGQTNTSHHRRGLSGHFEDLSEAGDSTEEQRKDLPALLGSGAQLHHMVSTGASRASTHSSSDWMGSEGDIKRGFEGVDLDKLPGDLEDEKDVGCGKEERQNRFSKVKSVIKSKLGRSKSKNGRLDGECCEEGED